MLKNNPSFKKKKIVVQSGTVQYSTVQYNTIRYSISTVQYCYYRYLNKKLNLDKILFHFIWKFAIGQNLFHFIWEIFICKTGLSKNSIKSSIIENSTCENMIWLAWERVYFRLKFSFSGIHFYEMSRRKNLCSVSREESSTQAKEDPARGLSYYLSACWKFIGKDDPC